MARTLRMGVPLALCLVALACAAPAWADDVYVTNHVPLSLEQPSGTVSQFDVGAGGALAPKSPAAVAAGFRPRGVAVSPDGQSVYVTNNGEHAVSQYDVVAGGALAPKSPATVDTGLVPTGVAVSPDGQSVYVTTSWSSVFQYDVGGDGALAPKSPATVAAGLIPTGVAVSPDGQSVYVTNQLSDDVSQFDVGAGGALSPKSSAAVAAGDQPFGIAVRPDVFPTIGELIDSVEALGLPRGIENGLVKKLENAQRNLDEGDTANACEKLASFIERVKAQSGKKIDVADADDLIADAEAIRAAEGCA